MRFSVICVVLLGIAFSHLSDGRATPFRHGIFNVNPSAEGNAFDIQISYGTDVYRAHGKLGMSHPVAVGSVESCGESCYKWGDYAQVEIKMGRAPNCGRIEWTSTFARDIEDCYDIDPNVHWYGGGETHTQTWPIQTNPRKESPYVTGDFLQNNDMYYGGVVENYWLLSNGAALIVDSGTPLYFALNTTRANRVCFTAKDQGPYTKRSPLTLNYEWCTGSNVKEAHQLAMNHYFEKPTDIPDEVMLIRPLWSTWAEYKTEVNQSIVLDFARRVVSEGFGNSSHIEIDDFWEPCHGELVFDEKNFPNPKAMIDEIKGMNMRATSWVHPFINYQCPTFNEGMSKGYFVKDGKGKTGITWWWRGDNSGLIDMTNPEAVEWYSSRLRKLQETTGLDAFKFDAGEANWLPASTVLSGDEKLLPNLYTTKYVDVVAKFGGLVETRVAHMNQKLPFFVRMLDKDSRWGYNNGLKSMIPTLLHFSIVGYAYVLPDMIGGNAYGDEMPSKELYVRWMQNNMFMPAVQFSLVPWKYDQETVDICLDVLAQREKYRDEILAAARQAVVDGSPVNRPIWWVDPTDAATYDIDDEYMLGDKILVAPVVEEGAVTRDIYLPAGTWVSGVDSKEHQGGQWLRNYPAPLKVTPFFIKSA